MKKFGVFALVSLLAVASAQASFTVATFASPSAGSFEPMFWVDWTGGTVNSGWTGSHLTLNFEAYNGNSFSSVWFEMDEISILSQIPGVEYGFTNGGEIRFYEEGTDTNPLLVITFASGEISKFSFGSDNAEFSGSQITLPLSDEQFSFAFAARQATSGAFSATATLNASAVMIPEPATIAIFGIGSALMFRVRKRNP